MRQQDRADVDMTPMLDIVFIMLIFFIVSAVFLNERAIDLTQNHGDNPQTHEIRSIGVYVYENGTAAINGRLIDVSSVPARIEVLRAEHPNANVSIRADYGTAFDNIVYLKDHLDLANIQCSLKISPENS